MERCRGSEWNDYGCVLILEAHPLLPFPCLRHAWTSFSSYDVVRFVNPEDECDRHRHRHVSGPAIFLISHCYREKIICQNENGGTYSRQERVILRETRHNLEFFLNCLFHSRLLHQVITKETTILIERFPHCIFENIKMEARDN